MALELIKQPIYEEPFEEKRIVPPRIQDCNGLRFIIPKAYFEFSNVVSLREQVGSKTCKKKQSIKFSIEYYYKVKNHQELYDIGHKYNSDVVQGEKNFSFCSIGTLNLNQRTILGLSAFFNYHFDKNIAVITENFKRSFYFQYMNDINYVEKLIPQINDKVITYTKEGLTFIEACEFQGKSSDKNIESIIDITLSNFDIIFWDLPDIQMLKKYRELYFPIISKNKNVTLILDKNNTSKKQVSASKQFFEEYHIKIKGVLISQS